MFVDIVCAAISKCFSLFSLTADVRRYCLCCYIHFKLSLFSLIADVRRYCLCLYLQVFQFVFVDCRCSSILSVLRDENFLRIRGIPRILVHSGSCESSRSVEIFLYQYRGGVGVFIPHDKLITIGLFRNVNRPFATSESRATRVTPL